MKKSGFIAIVGRPNAGKSTLLNTVLDYRLSAVSYKPQMTRENLFGIYQTKLGQIVFVDTPGIHRAKVGGLNECMNQNALQSLEDPDLIWYLCDPQSNLEVEAQCVETLKKSNKPIFFILTKSDLSLHPSKFMWTESIPLEFSKKFHISAEKKVGLQELLDESWKLIPEGEAYFDDPEMVSDKPMRYFVSEMIREECFHQLGDEIPYSCAVVIQEFKEDKRPVYINAHILVERESQKSMVIGKGGAKIKAIGSSSRLVIEKFIGEKVFLDLQVKVLKNWTKNANALKQLGYLDKGIK